VTSATLPSISALSNAVLLKERTLSGSVDWTLASAFPAYMGLTKVSSDMISTMSIMGDAFNTAAARGKTLDPNLVAGAIM